MTLAPGLIPTCARGAGARARTSWERAHGIGSLAPRGDAARTFSSVSSSFFSNPLYISFCTSLGTSCSWSMSSLSCPTVEASGRVTSVLCLPYAMVKVTAGPPCSAAISSWVRFDIAPSAATYSRRRQPSVSAAGGGL